MRNLKRFMSYFRPHRRLLYLDLLCATFVAGIDLVFPFLSRFALTSLFPNMTAGSDSARVFFWMIGGLLLAYGVRALLVFIINYWGHMLGVRMEADMRTEIFEHLQSLPFSFFDKTRTGQLLTRVTNDLFDIVELAHHGPEELLISSLTIVGAFTLMFFVDWRLALVLIALVPLTVWFVAVARRSMRRNSLLVKERIAEINTGIESSLSGARTAKAFANEPYEIRRFSGYTDRFRTAKNSFYRAMGIFNGGAEFFTSLFPFMIIAGGGFFLLRGGVDTVTLLTFSLYGAALTGPIRRVAFLAEQYMMGMAGFSRFLEIMDTEPEIVDKPDAIALENVSGDIAIHNVSFSYDDHEKVLSHINLDVPSGKTLAIVGPSGGGKTTLCNLLLRFYEVQDGEILVDGTDIRDVTMKSLRRNIGIVQQDVFLFAGTVADNIRYGRPSASDEEVHEAAERAHIHDEILKMEDGYDTQVGERGTRLSGGQKQRISIARLFLKNPPVLILDEATSALDSLTEFEIQRSFAALSEGRTTLVIAHRLSTVKNADEIIVLDEHGIVERGRHEELLAGGGLYATYHRAMRVE
ncbi:MAG: ABC transporter ATP-binding protein/permease [Clostridiales bacterium]|nr:ABC transporter ATP-binding protein/permease [Clostridiales bacterium]